ncbi:hypothetical protein, partial [Rubrivirga sp.]|uniref:hypothetical protein n=1 Tax=Rubrivirga sp. TaxID=1885344 RepID=UPI003C76B3A6
RLALGGVVSAADLERARALVDTLTTPATLLHLADLQAVAGLPSSRTYQQAVDSLSAVDAVSRLGISRRRALEAEVVRDVLAASPFDVPEALVDADPVLAALRFSALDEPVRAWRLASTWCLEDDTTEASRVARFLQSRIAYRAGALEAGDALRAGLADAFRVSGPTSLAPVLEDDERRSEWRQSRRRLPPIFDLQPPVLDALASCAPDRSPRPGRLRAP